MFASRQKGTLGEEIKSIPSFRLFYCVQVCVPSLMQKKSQNPLNKTWEKACQTFPFYFVALILRQTAVHTSTASHSTWYQDICPLPIEETPFINLCLFQGREISIRKQKTVWFSCIVVLRCTDASSDRQYYFRHDIKGNYALLNSCLCCWVVWLVRLIVATILFQVIYNH